MSFLGKRRKINHHIIPTVGGGSNPDLNERPFFIHEFGEDSLAIDLELEKI